MPPVIVEAIPCAGQAQALHAQPAAAEDDPSITETKGANA
jgi:hypothetical protein